MLACEGAEDELRHRHVGRSVDPVARHVPEHDGEPSVRELEEVVNVAADLDARRRLVDGADLQAEELRPRPRQQRALHRLGELLALLLEARVVQRKRGRPGDREGRGERVGPDRLLHAQREERQGPEDSLVGGERDDRRGRALVEERDERLVRRAESARGLRVEHDDVTAAIGARPHGREGLRQRHDPAQRLGEPLLAHVRGHRHEGVAPLMRDPQHGRVHLELLDDRADDDVERVVE